MIKDQCPPSECWQAYIDHELNSTQAQDLEDHLQGCSVCNRLVRNLMEENQWLTNMFWSENQTLQVPVSWERWSAANVGYSWGWIGTGFMVLAVIISWINGQFVQDIGLITWLQSFSARLLAAAAFQEFIADSWQLFLKLGWWYSNPQVISRLSLITSIIVSGLGLAAVSLISRKIVWPKEV